MVALLPHLPRTPATRWRVSVSQGRARRTTSVTCSRGSCRSPWYACAAATRRISGGGRSLAPAEKEGDRDALEGKGPNRLPHRKRFGRRLEEVAKAVGGGYCRLQMPLRLALGVRGPQKHCFRVRPCHSERRRWLFVPTVACSLVHCKVTVQQHPCPSAGSCAAWTVPIAEY